MVAAHAQLLAVAPVVAACFGYSAWALMPAALRRRLAIVLSRVRWIGRLPSVARAARASGGCGCDGCDRSAVAQKPTADDAVNRTSVIRIVPRQQPR
jgi:hypothetical protein